MKKNDNDILKRLIALDNGGRRSGGDRRKERAETVELAGSVINATERVYLFFEILQ